MASLAFYMQYFVSDCIPLLTLSLSLPCKLFFIIIISLLLNRHFFSGEKNLLEARSQHKNHKTARLNIGFLLIPCIYSHWFTQTSDIHKSFISQMLKNPVIIDQCFWIIDASTKMIAAKKQLNRHILGSIFNAKTSLTGLYESDWCFGERKKSFLIRATYRFPVIDILLRTRYRSFVYLLLSFFFSILILLLLVSIFHVCLWICLSLYL